LFAAPDTLAVVLNGPAEHCHPLREVVPPGRPLLLWSQHASDQPAMQALRNPAVASGWDGIVCISDWQRRTYIEELGVPPGRTIILRNAIGPAFENLFRNPQQLDDAKPLAVKLAYTSTPFRGLDVLLDCFPTIRSRHPNATLQVFSSMQVYATPAEQD